MSTDRSPFLPATLLTRLRPFLPVAGAVLIIFLLVIANGGPSKRPVEEATTAVRTVEVVQGAVVPRAIGFGTVAPATEWQGIAEVGGRVIFRHPELRPGFLLEKDTEIIRIDPVDIELTIARLQANIRASEASLTQLAQEEENTAQSLAIEERALTLSERDLKRQQDLLKRGTASQAAVDNQERAVLTQRQSVQSLRNQVSLYPAQRALREAELDLARVQLAEAARDLTRTVITLPLDARIGTVSVDPEQVVTVGQVMVEADGLETAEIIAQLPLGRVFHLFPPRPDRPLDPSDIFAQGQGTVPILEELGLTARVSLVSAPVGASWDARVVRFSESVDPQTRTIGVVVAVDDPYSKAVPGERPPLTRNMYVSVELIGAAQPDLLVVPSTALRGDRLHLVTDDNRLEIRPVKLAFIQGDLAIVSTGIEAGERVVVSDLIPAVPGMKLAPEADPDLSTRIKAAMAGEGGLR